MKLAKNLESVQRAIRHLNDCLESHPDLADRLGFAHAFYVLERDDDKPLFGFSKFVGYEDLSADEYLQNYHQLNGRNTEHVLDSWFEEVRIGSPAYQVLYDELREWMALYGKRPREGGKQQVRIMIVRSEFRDDLAPNREDRRLLDLMLAVADLLPPGQRHELRAAL